MVEGIKELFLMNQNSRREFVLNILASNVVISKKGEISKRYPRIILGANVRPLAKLRGFKFLVGEYFVS